MNPDTIEPVNLTSVDLVAYPKYYPGIKGVNIRAADWDYKAEVQAFHENDRNCNTCVHLRRRKHPKDKFGTLYGDCASTPINHPYPTTDGIWFHPDDAMLMECYQPRWQSGTSPNVPAAQG